MAGEEWSDRPIDRGAALDREVDRLRAVYRNHAETLSKLAASSPSKQLARHYQELIAEINKAIVGLDGVDPDAIARKSGERPAPTVDREAPTRESKMPAGGAPIAAPTRPPIPERPILSSYTAAAPVAEGDEGTVFRVALIIGLAIVVLCVLALFVWKFSGDRPTPPAPRPAEETAAPPAKEEVVTPVPEAPKAAALLSVTPEQQDFGTIAKGTSEVRTFEIANHTAKEITLEVARSKCRCLWYDPPKSLPAGGRGTLTVRVDGSRVKAGPLSESIEISAKGERNAVAVIEINAEVK